MSSTLTSPEAGSTATAADEIRSQIRLALTAHGNRPDLAGRDRAIHWLLAHATEAYPIVLEHVRATPGSAAIALLGRFDRPESTALLVGSLGSDVSAEAEAAARALGAASDPAARTAVLEAIRNAAPEIASGALDGLRQRGDRAACPAIVAATAHASAEVRFVAVEAGVALGCLDGAALERLAKSDPDPDVRARAAALVEKP